MPFTDLTSTASVRSALGVSEKEIRDDVLLDPIYSTILFEALYEISPQLVTDFAAIAPLDPKSAAQERFFNLTQTFSAYNIAVQCLGAVAMFAPMTIKDSRSELTRNSDPYAALRTDLPRSLALIRTWLQQAYAAINPTVPVPTAIERIRAVASPLAVDPVTG